MTVVLIDDELYPFKKLEAGCGTHLNPNIQEAEAEWLQGYIERKISCLKGDISKQ